MFFEKEILSFNILDVIELNQKNVNSFNSGRNFNALSFRFCSNAKIKCKNVETQLKNNSICYVPARIDYERVASVDEMIIIHFDTTDYVTSDIEYFLPRDYSVFSALFKKILACWKEKELGYKYKCSAILYEIFGECYNQNYIQKTKNSKIQNSIDYLLSSYKNPNLTIKEIADKSFVSEVYFRKLFKAEFGVSPQKYIIDLRIQNAMGLISTGYYSLKEIAYMSGYLDYKYFLVEFKKLKGVSPSEYLYNFRK